MAAATVFCAFLAPFFALVIGLALVTFTPLKRASSANKFISTALFVGGITALGWAPLLLSDSVGVWAYSGVLVLSSLYQAVVILFVSAEVLTDHSVEQDHPGASRTSGAREQSVLMSPHGQSNGAPLAQRMEAAQTDKQAAPRMESCSALPPCPKPALVSRQ